MLFCYDLIKDNPFCRRIGRLSRLRFRPSHLCIHTSRSRSKHSSLVSPKESCSAIRPCEHPCSRARSSGLFEPDRAQTKSGIPLTIDQIYPRHNHGVATHSRHFKKVLWKETKCSRPSSIRGRSTAALRRSVQFKQASSLVPNL